MNTSHRSQSPLTLVDGDLSTDPTDIDAALVATPNAVPRPGDVARWIDLGARFVGGCCGVSAADLATLGAAMGSREML